MMDYNETVALWKEAYKFCLGYDARIGNDPEITQEDVNEYLKSKAELMVNLLKMFIIESMENKGTYDIDYMTELLATLEDEMTTEEIPMTTFDSNYMREIIVEAKEDYDNAE